MLNDNSIKYPVMYFKLATLGLMLVGLEIQLLAYNQYTTPENAKESTTQKIVHKLASFELIMCGVLLKTPRSNARKINIANKKIPQTSINSNFSQI